MAHVGARGKPYAMWKTLKTGHCYAFPHVNLPLSSALRPASHPCPFQTSSPPALLHPARRSHNAESRPNGDSSGRHKGHDPLLSRTGTWRQLIIHLAASQSGRRCGVLPLSLFQTRPQWVNIVPVPFDGHRPLSLANLPLSTISILTDLRLAYGFLMLTCHCYFNAHPISHTSVMTYHQLSGGLRQVFSRTIDADMAEASYLGNL